MWTSRNVMDTNVQFNFISNEIALHFPAKSKLKTDRWTVSNQLNPAHPPPPCSLPHNSLGRGYCTVSLQGMCRGWEMLFLKCSAALQPSMLEYMSATPEHNNPWHYLWTCDTRKSHTDQGALVYNSLWLHLVRSEDTCHYFWSVRVYLIPSFSSGILHHFGLK